MKYVFLAYMDVKQWDAKSTHERDALTDACLTNEQDLRESGHLFAVEGLQSSSSAIMVQVVDGEVSLAGVPLTEAKGQLIRLFFINARDLNEAIQVATRMPQVYMGPIEVRPQIDLRTPRPARG